MIRRDLPADSDQPARWVLIRQIDHARLAGKLAEQWGAGQFAPIEPRQQLLWAIDHHDDGWHDWDNAPDVDPANGRPRAFTEMPVDDQLTIWSASIDEAARAGELEGYLVAGHFCSLARRAAAWRSEEPDWPRAETFLTDYESRMIDWLATWQRRDPATHTTALAERALAQLQFFDLLSLWFCCAEATEPDQVATPGGLELTLVPGDPGHVGLSPWPLLVDAANIEVAGRVIPAARYPSRQELAATVSENVVLRWELRPAGPAEQSV